MFTPSISYFCDDPYSYQITILSVPLSVKNLHNATNKTACPIYHKDPYS